MKLSQSVFAVFVLIVGTASAQDSCRLVEITDRQKGDPVTVEPIMNPGKYCLRKDMRSPRVYVFSDGGERSYPLSSMLAITASDVMFDLQGYTMHAEAGGMQGIRSGHWEVSRFQRNIVIRNGKVVSRTNYGIILKDAFHLNYPGSLLSDFTEGYFKPDSPKNEALSFRLANRAYREMQKALPDNPGKYPTTNHVIEKLNVDAKLLSVIIAGAGNIIRNSTIEVTDGHAAIYLFGPNQIIENNIIVFKGKAAVESAAAIKLHQADGTVIRDNDIIIENGFFGPSPKAAISLIDSKNVIAENNRIYGINTLARAWDDKSTVIERNNENLPIWKRPSDAAEPGVH